MDKRRNRAHRALVPTTSTAGMQCVQVVGNHASVDVFQRTERRKEGRKEEKCVGESLWVVGKVFESILPQVLWIVYTSGDNVDRHCHRVERVLEVRSLIS